MYLILQAQRPTTPMSLHLLCVMEHSICQWDMALVTYLRLHHWFYLLLQELTLLLHLRLKAQFKSM